MTLSPGLATRPPVEVSPVIRTTVRGLCGKPYPGHPRGCPNVGRRSTCPPEALLLPKVLDLRKPVYCIYNAFDLGAHVARMKAKHRDWSDRQLRCCLYWQGTSRAALRKKIDAFLEDRPGLIAIKCPEACGVDVTATMASIGVTLEWPPVNTAYRVALVGSPKTRALSRAHYHQP